MNTSSLVRIAALVMILAIALGAFGAHALEEKLAAAGHVETWKTAVLYHMIHGLAMFVVAVVARGKVSVSYWLWLVGIFLFSGSLYVLSLTGITAKPVVLATPLGGLTFMIGWLILLIKPGAVSRGE